MLYHVNSFRQSVYAIPFDGQVFRESTTLALQSVFNEIQVVWDFVSFQLKNYASCFSWWISDLQQTSSDSVSTKDLTTAFGWNSYESFQQQDVQVGTHSLHCVIYLLFPPPSPIFTCVDRKCSVFSWIVWRSVWKGPPQMELLRSFFVVVLRAISGASMSRMRALEKRISMICRWGFCYIGYIICYEDTFIPLLLLLHTLSLSLSYT